MKMFCILAAAAVLAIVATPRAVAQQTTPPDQISPELLKQREAWRIAMAQVPLPRKGCFESAFPNREWREVTCVAAPDYPMPPKVGPVPLTVGNGDDIAAVAPSGTISTTIGTFDSLTNVTSETGQVNATGPVVNDAYTIQINTNFMQNATICAGASVPADCRVWEQFVFENNNVSHRAFIQYWLIKYGNPCPAGQSWIPRTIGMINYCYKNNTGGAVSTTNQPVTNLANVSLSGAVTATSDTVTLADGGMMWARAGDNAVGAAVGWTQSEFNIVGDAGSGQANFNAGADMTLRTRIIYGGTAAPTCRATGFTGETNNLSFGPSAPTASQPGPAVIFRQSTAGGATSNCAAAVTVGDTHLQTFGGLFYDFQASGDFLLAQVEPDFVVQTRQVSGAPTWPNASVNSAVATQMGKTKVALCLGSRLNVDGANTEIADGQSLSTPDGVSIWHVGNVYTIISPSGDSVRATVNAKYLDVAVGLGHWPAKVTGLLANANNNVNQIAARDGTVFTNQFSFDALYNRVGESWRVSPKESMLDACGGEAVAAKNPTRPFYARDLDQETFNRTHAVCVAAGVKGDTLLDVCTLDVAVIGDDAAAKVFVDLRTPVAEARPTFTDHGDGWWKKWWWLIFILVIVLIALLRSGR